jgi:F-box-like
LVRQPYGTLTAGSGGIPAGTAIKFGLERLQGHGAAAATMHPSTNMDASKPTVKRTGKHLLRRKNDQSVGRLKCPRSAASTNSDEDSGIHSDERKSPDTAEDGLFASLPEEVTCKVMSYLDINSLLDMRRINRSFHTLASTDSAGWRNHFQQLRENKIHIPPAALVSRIDSMDAYRMSVEDARTRNHIESHELMFDPCTRTGTVWSFRFKEAAGTDWTSWDPWYHGQPCRKMVFLQDGKVKEYKPENASLDDPPFSQHMGIMVDPPIPMLWRYVARPLDMPAKPHGSYIRLSVAGRDVPTYCIYRSPTNNWGFIMESCWGVYASFELPKRPSRPQQQRRYRLRRAHDTDGNWFNLEVEVSDDEEEDEGETVSSGERTPPEPQFLVDDRSFSVTSGLQWREAFLYNHGARQLPEDGDAAPDASFDRRLYALINNT